MSFNKAFANMRRRLASDEEVLHDMKFFMSLPYQNFRNMIAMMCKVPDDASAEYYAHLVVDLRLNYGQAIGGDDGKNGAIFEKMNQRLNQEETDLDKAYSVMRKHLSSDAEVVEDMEIFMKLPYENFCKVIETICNITDDATPDDYADALLDFGELLAPLVEK